MQPLAGNQRPDLQTSLVKISPVLRLPREVHVCRHPANVSCLIVFELLQNHHGLDRFAPFFSLLTRCRIHCVCHKKRRFNVQKWSEHLVFFHFHCETCFGPQPRPLFQHLNVQKWSETVSICQYYV